MKISFDAQFLDLKGYPLPQRMDETLANELSSSSIGDPAQMIKWATDLINNGEIEISAQDAEFFKKFIESNIRLTNLAKAQMLEKIERAKR